MPNKYLVHCICLLLVLAVGLPCVAQQMAERPNQDRRVMTIKPQFLPPSEIIEFLGARELGGMSVVTWQAPDGNHFVEVRHNDPANLIMLTGDTRDIKYVADMIHEADIPPRQIEIEVKIIEINDSKARDIGLDWQEMIDRAAPRANYRYNENRRDNYSENLTTGQIYDTEQKDITKYFELTATVYLDHIVKILDETGVGSVHSAPKILTLNNRRATILDGERVTYVTRYSSYTNLFETDSMDAGLTISVLPSLGESGYITLDINAEFTALGGEISGSPIKTGQLIENTIVVKDGQSIMLGGLTRTAEYKSKKRFPILGHILPFIFSREVSGYDHIESFMILTPRVVDFEGNIDAHTQGIVEPTPSEGK